MSNAKFKRSQAELAAKRAAMVKPIETSERVVTATRSGVKVTPSPKLIKKSVSWLDKATGQRRYGKIECRGATCSVTSSRTTTRQMVTACEPAMAMVEQPGYSWLPKGKGF